MAFKMRTSKPEAGNKYYITKANGGYSDAIKGSPTDKDCDVLSNCVGYAYGRFNEIGEYGYCKYLRPVNAENFIQYKGTSLKTGQTPKLGACMVWQKGATLNGSDGAGHVAIVEKVVSDTEVYTSESGWGSSNPFWNKTRTKGNGNWGQGAAYKFLGFIYNPAVSDEKPADTTPAPSTSGSTDEKTIWNYLLGKIGNEYGVAGLMGNLYAESCLRPNNLQNAYEKRLGYTDASYTAAVDNGSYTKFGTDSAGYGLAQWTYHTRKKALLAFAQSKKKSIGDLNMQLEFMYKELGESYKGVLADLKSAKTVLAASNSVLTKFERPANQSAAVQSKRAEFGQKYYEKYAGKTVPSTPQETKKETTNMGYTNSSLVSYTKLSPNHSGQRTQAIDRITPHCVVGQCSVETLGNIFAPTSKQASCNYGIGVDGRVGMYVEEKNRSWCSSSAANDQRAITIECASDSTAPYAFKDVVYNKLIELCVDICRRNGKNKLLWFGDKTKTLNYTPKSGEMVLTVHRWFANKSCPGDWMYARMGDLATKVTQKLSGGTTDTGKTDTPASDATTLYRVQAGAFAKKANADAFAAKLKAAGFATYIVRIGGLYKVQVGAFAKKANAENMMAKLKAAGDSGFITTQTGATTKNEPAKKTAAEIAKEIFYGTCSDSRWSTWGNGATRTSRLKQAGYNPSEVQAEVNKLFSK